MGHSITESEVEQAALDILPLRGMELFMGRILRQMAQVREAELHRCFVIGRLRRRSIG